MQPPIRQGDICLIDRPIPEGAKDITPADGVIVLAAGSVSQHRHAFVMQPVRLLEHDGKRYLDVRGEARLDVLGDTQRHTPHIVPVGTREVRGQQEFIEEWRNVND